MEKQILLIDGVSLCIDFCGYDVFLFGWLTVLYHKFIVEIL